MAKAADRPAADGMFLKALVLAIICLLPMPYSFPANIDPDKQYLLYLHGKILEDQGIPAVSSVPGAEQGSMAWHRQAEQQHRQERYFQEMQERAIQRFEEPRRLNDDLAPPLHE